MIFLTAQDEARMLRPLKEILHFFIVFQPDFHMEQDDV